MARLAAKRGRGAHDRVRLDELLSVAGGDNRTGDRAPRAVPDYRRRLGTTTGQTDDRWSGVRVAAPTKFLPAIFIPYLFVKGYRKAGWAAALIAAVIALVTQPLLGWQNSVTLAMARTEQAGASFPAAYANQGITNVLYKIFTVFNIDEPRPATLYPEPLHVIGGLLSLAVLLATGWFIVRRRRSRLIEIECALLAIVMCWW